MASIVDKLLGSLGFNTRIGSIDTGLSIPGGISTGIDPLKLMRSTSKARNQWDRSKAGAWKNLDDSKLDTDIHDATSSNVDFYQWDEDDKKLIIGFLNGYVYEYDCPYSYFVSLNNAGSKGKWVWQNLRPYDLKKNKGSSWAAPKIPYRRIK